jgi:RNA polymerase sigma-70 factor (ECF subfamily)
MDKSFVEIWYKLANGKRIRLEVSIEVKELLEQADRQICSQRRQERRHHTEYVDALTDTTTVLLQESCADLVSRRDSYQRLYVTIAKLPVVQRRRLLMYYFDGLTYRQIAKLEGVGSKTVIRTVARAIETLRMVHLP